MVIVCIFVAMIAGLSSLSICFFKKNATLTVFYSSDAAVYLGVLQ